uniref:Uncharacterized protein n=1 Tax=Hyaloperonospora arabidopsidis (strain Emoy2) TaxID=559515 RepID=M4B956_HYAAE
MKLGESQWAIATAIYSREEKSKTFSKRQLKKLLRAERDSVERQAKKYKSKQEAKSAARFQTGVPKYSFVNGSGEGTIVRSDCVHGRLSDGRVL